MGSMNFANLKEWVDQSWKDQGRQRQSWGEEFDFVAGHQWTDEERAKMEETERAAIVFNRTAVIISSVVGSEINNRTEVRYIPREIGDAKPNEVVSAGGEWFRDLANAEDSDSEAFEDLLVCGIGLTETGLDFEADPDGEPFTRRIDPLEFGYDPHARQKGLADARFLYRVISMPRSEAEDRFEGVAADDINADWVTAPPETEKHVNRAGDQWKGDETGKDDNLDTVTVVQIQWRERVKSVEYIDPMTGQKQEMPLADWKKLEKVGPINTPNRQRVKWVWHQAFLGRTAILDQNQPDPDRSTFNVMTGYWDRKDKRWVGMLRAMRDPQKFANKWLSQTLHILNSNAKGGVMVEEDAVYNQRQFEESWAAADGVTYLKAGAISGGRIQEKPKAQMPAAFMQLTEFAVTSIRDASGVNMELLGLRDANQPGILEYQRRQSAMTTLARFFDALRFYRKNQGETILNFLRNYIAPTGQLVRLVKEGQEQYVPLAMEADTRRYDVIVDDAPQAPNEKEKSWQVIQAMLPLLQNANLGLEDWADILEYSPLPISFAEKVRAKAMQAQKQGPSVQERLGEAQIKKTEADAAKSMADAQSRGSEAHMQQMEMAQRGVEIQAEQAQTGIDLQNSMLDAQMKQEERQHERDRWAFELQMEALRLETARASARNTSREASPA